MAKARKKDKETVKWKKKGWYPILAPSLFNNQVLGETTTFEPNKMLGKTLQVNLMNLTGEVRNQNVNILFKVTSINDNKALTELMSYSLSPSFIKRVVRRGHTRADSTYMLKTKDNRKVVVKSILITRHIVNRSVVTALRKNALEFLTQIVSGQSYDDLFRNIIYYKLQIELKKRLSKTYPLKTYDIKKMQLVEKDIEKQQKG